MKRVLFDENVPRNLRRDLPDFVVQTVQESGWAGLKNGALLRKADPSFDVLLTVDQRLRYQQNVSQFAIGVVAIETFDTTLANLRTLLPQIKAAIENSAPGTITIVRPEVRRGITNTPMRSRGLSFLVLLLACGSISCSS